MRANACTGPCEINPANYYEFFLQGFMMLIGSSLWAYIIGSGCGIVATLNPAAEEHRRIVGQLNHYVRDHDCPDELAARLRVYFNETSRLRYYQEEKQVLMRTMTPQLRGEASLSVACGLFKRVPYLSAADIETGFLSRAALALSGAVYCPREQISCEPLTLVTSGLVAKNGKLGTQLLGADVILNLMALRDLQPAMALTFTQASSIDRGTLDGLLVDHPVAARHVRRHMIRLTLQRVVLRVAAHAREAFTGQLRGSVFADRLTLLDAFEQVRASFLPPNLSAELPLTPAEVRASELDAKLVALGRQMDGRLDELAKAVQCLIEVRQPPAVAPAAAPTATGASGTAPSFHARMERRMDELSSAIHLLVKGQHAAAHEDPIAASLAFRCGDTRAHSSSMSSTSSSRPTTPAAEGWSARCQLGPTRVSRKEIDASPSSPVKDRPVLVQKLHRRRGGRHSYEGSASPVRTGKDNASAASSPVAPSTLATGIDSSSKSVGGTPQASPLVPPAGFRSCSSNEGAGGGTSVSGYCSWRRRSQDPPVLPSACPQAQSSGSATNPAAGSFKYKC